MSLHAMQIGIAYLLHAGRQARRADVQNGEQRAAREHLRVVFSVQSLIVIKVLHANRRRRKRDVIQISLSGASWGLALLERPAERVRSGRDENADRLERLGPKPLRHLAIDIGSEGRRHKTASRR